MWRTLMNCTRRRNGGLRLAMIALIYSVAIAAGLPATIQAQASKKAEPHADAPSLGKIAQLAADAKLLDGRFDAATQKQLALLVAGLTDLQVRRDAEQLLPALEKTAVRYARDSLLLAEIK